MQRSKEPDEALRGLYISEGEVERLLNRPAGMFVDTALGHDFPEEFTQPLQQLSEDIIRRKEESLRRGIDLRLETLTQEFDLTPFEVDTLLLCLVPELDLGYERLLAYIQDDVTKRRPLVDLALNLFCTSLREKSDCRRRFLPDGPLVHWRLLHVLDDPSFPPTPLPARFLRLDERVVDFLLGHDVLEATLAPFVTYLPPQDESPETYLPVAMKKRVQSLWLAAAGQRHGFIFFFQGPEGVGRKAMAAELGRRQGQGLLAVDGHRLLADSGLSWDIAVRLITREARLLHAAIFWEGCEALAAEEHNFRWATLVKELDRHSGPIFLSGTVRGQMLNPLPQQPLLPVDFPQPEPEQRLRLWQKSLPEETTLDLADLANKFRFTGGRIRDAATTARQLARWRDPENDTLTMADLYEACRSHGNRNLANLAQKLTLRYRWEHIVLPDDQLQQLKEICQFVRYRAVVYNQWGFDRRLSLGKGLNVLFAGPSGTGKTMAAEILAHDLELELYKIDLSLVVSKYIGETEKNLSRIFAEAETSNAVLFFDEADALFGKRSEVKDAHDRYANIEIAYLLQKMEEYEGVVILATNLRKNMDEAFVRRLAMTVTFPFPEEDDRLRIWEGIWPPETPRAGDLDLGFMARQFKVAGGNIKNIALGAAFLAAGDGRRVTMKHLIKATKREYQKMGKVCVENDFGPFFHLIEGCDS